MLLNSSDMPVKHHLVAYDMMVELTFNSKFLSLKVGFWGKNFDYNVVGTIIK